jgi:CubicO group peptidase (beta-lactamase class C family)
MMRAMTYRLLVIALGITCLTLTLTAAGAVPTGKAEDVGMSTERLERIREAVKRHIDAGALPGAVTLVARNGRIVHFEAHGVIDVEAKRVMPKDGVFRLASMSKPITAVAVMMLVEEGRIRLNDPVSRFIPEFKSARVAVPKQSAAAGSSAPGTTAPPAPPGQAAGPEGGRGRGGRGQAVELELINATRAITVRDLLTHTSGLMTSGGPANGASMATPPAQRTDSDTLATYIPKLGSVPLDYQPGTLWRYSGLAGFDVLSRIVEVASGLPFDQFLQQRLFDPLGMKDTGFPLTGPKASRVVPMYQRGQNGGFTRAQNQGGLSSATYFSGAGGLSSTAEDYLQFAQMLLNGGELNGRRYLGPRTVALMSSNHTGDMVNGQFGRPARGMGFGLGVQEVEDPIAADLRVGKGAWGWAGAYGTNFHIDPTERMVLIIMMQTSVGALQRDFETAVSQAIVGEAVGRK